MPFSDTSQSMKTLLATLIFMLACSLHAEEIPRYRFQFLTNDLSFVDGRPVFSPDGKTIVFMRQANDHNPGSRASLYTVCADGSKQAELLFDGINPKTNEPFNATRPDYSWSRKKYGGMAIKKPAMIHSICLFSYSRGVLR